MNKCDVIKQIRKNKTTESWKKGRNNKKKDIFQIDYNILCEYNCGKVALYELKNGKKCCSKSSNSCISNKKKNSDKLKSKHLLNPNLFECRYKNTSNESKNKMKWSKGKTKYTDEKVKQLGETHSKRLKSGELIPSFLGKHHSIESRQKISNHANERNNGYVKCKYYEVECLYMNKIVKVQGTYEEAYAKYLNNNKINWIRSTKYKLKYKLFKEDYVHNYFPDFYLPDTNEYIEIKGRYWKSKDGRVDDKRKMEAIIQCNLDKNIKIYLYDDLKLMNIL
jgi:hypothetical protein